MDPRRRELSLPAVAARRAEPGAWRAHRRQNRDRLSRNARRRAGTVAPCCRKPGRGWALQCPSPRSDRRDSSRHILYPRIPASHGRGLRSDQSFAFCPWHPTSSSELAAPPSQSSNSIIDKTKAIGPKISPTQTGRGEKRINEEKRKRGAEGGK